MQTLHKSKKRRIIKIDRNAQQLAQDHLFQISYLNQDKFDDQSQFLSVQTNIQKDSTAKRDTFYQDIRRIIRKNKRDNDRRRHNHHLFDHPQKFVNKEIRTKTQRNRIINNKIMSQSVFVGTQPKQTSKQKEVNYLLIQKKKRLGTCPVISSQNQSPVKKSKTQVAQMSETMMVGKPGLKMKKCNFSTISNWKIRNRHKEIISQIKDKMRDRLFFKQGFNSTIY